MTQQQRVSDVAGGIGSFSKILRMMLQSAMLGLGAYLVLRQEATAGIIIAGSILWPAHWRQPISRSQTGRASSWPGRAGKGSINS